VEPSFAVWVLQALEEDHVRRQKGRSDAGDTPSTSGRSGEEGSGSEPDFDMEVGQPPLPLQME
jgi:hypothetical protein